MSDTRRGNSLFGEIRRMARTSGAVGGIAARVAGERYLGLKTDKSAHAEDLRAVLGGLKGPMMKVAQLLSTIPDALPEEYARELSQLQSNAPAMGWPFVRRRMSTELGPAWQSRFTAFGQTAAAAASLGQVHRATLPDGREVACKLQYPDMPSVVEADLRQLRLAMGIYARMDSSIQSDDVYAELSERLREELDYEREAAHMRLYRLMLAGEPEIRVPEPVPELTTKRLLTMTWLEGRAIQSRIDEDPPQEERDAYARVLFRAWYVPFYHYGVIHGDPHLGNYQIRSDLHGINLLDFGTIRVFPPHFVTAVVRLYEAVRDGDDEKAIHAFEAWGFRNLPRETWQVLMKWARFLHEPLIDDRVRPISETQDPQFGRKVAEEVHAGLKKTGGVRPPREFVLMDRSTVGLGSVFLRLKAKQNWHRLFEELIAGYDEDALAARQAEALRQAGVPAAG
ncbi:2-polyprenylphenol 6-hydroxylase accessory protein ubiB [Roseomonas mucosa]|uniref:ABC transporter ATP-binding protein n=1 Tax=Roseomonas mucosa TaxID=207340 RepID=A0A1S8D8A5_9PROT|nr:MULTISPECIES: AarF/ABC1/UbiB kinase family protein [Roseomonas]MDT8264173.1 AarF/ABC1/UbiB kinase family protein [Roseomonas sp. DSM 102946]ATR20769.1 ABC transporter ATP-binding protein [Roseomonas sp. FDAARGOS_362]MCG7352285.1 AarF/ABC1/UbiB kinase family protein [Roseomonas mucosa]MCG7357179.1 AarF/ABC1/UbiB kinase family protein [Roseomonas mucosa]MDT8291185.1 AarF/ABC1/UbiB kinase family protein [Roseomonas mucosa]